MLKQADSAAVGQPDIEQDTVIPEEPQFLPRPFQCLAGFADISLPPQKIPDIPGELLVVFDDQDLHSAKLTSFAPTGPARIPPRAPHRYPAACRWKSSAYLPPCASSSSCEPISSISPRSSTSILSAIRTVENRCEISTAVRPLVKSANR